MEGLDLSRTGVTDIAPWLCAAPFATLKHLDVSRNALRSCAGINTLSSLHSLSLYYNRIDHIRDLAPLCACSKLRVLDLRLNPVCRRDEYRGRVVALLPFLVTLDGRPVTEADKAAFDITQGRGGIEAALQDISETTVMGGIHSNNNSSSNSSSQNNALSPTTSSTSSSPSSNLLLPDQLRGIATMTDGSRATVLLKRNIPSSNSNSNGNSNGSNSSPTTSSIDDNPLPTKPEQQIHGVLPQRKDLISNTPQATLPSSSANAPPSPSPPSSSENLPPSGTSKETTCSSTCVSRNTNYEAALAPTHPQQDKNKVSVPLSSSLMVPASSTAKPQQQQQQDKPKKPLSVRSTTSSHTSESNNNSKRKNTFESIQDRAENIAAASVTPTHAVENNTEGLMSEEQAMSWQSQLHRHHHHQSQQQQPSVIMPSARDLIRMIPADNAMITTTNYPAGHSNSSSSSSSSSSIFTQPVMDTSSSLAALNAILASSAFSPSATSATTIGTPLGSLSSPFRYSYPLPSSASAENIQPSLVTATTPVNNTAVTSETMRELLATFTAKTTPPVQSTTTIATTTTAGAELPLSTPLQQTADILEMQQQNPIPSLGLLHPPPAETTVTQPSSPPPPPPSTLRMTSIPPPQPLSQQQHQQRSSGLTTATTTASTAAARIALAAKLRSPQRPSFNKYFKANNNQNNDDIHTNQNSLQFENTIVMQKEMISGPSNDENNPVIFSMHSSLSSNSFARNVFTPLVLQESEQQQSSSSKARDIQKTIKMKRKSGSNSGVVSVTSVMSAAAAAAVKKEEEVTVVGIQEQLLNKATAAARQQQAKTASENDMVESASTTEVESSSTTVLEVSSIDASNSDIEDEESDEVAGEIGHQKLPQRGTSTSTSTSTTTTTTTATTSVSRNTESPLVVVSNIPRIPDMIAAAARARSVGAHSSLRPPFSTDCIESYKGNEEGGGVKELPIFTGCEAKHGKASHPRDQTTTSTKEKKVVTLGSKKLGNSNQETRNKKIAPSVNPLVNHSASYQNRLSRLDLTTIKPSKSKSLIALLPPTSNGNNSASSTTSTFLDEITENHATEPNIVTDDTTTLALSPSHSLPRSFQQQQQQRLLSEASSSSSRSGATNTSTLDNNNNSHSTSTQPWQTFASAQLELLFLLRSAHDRLARENEETRALAASASAEVTALRRELESATLREQNLEKEMAREREQLQLQHDLSRNAELNALRAELLALKETNKGLEHAVIAARATPVILTPQKSSTDAEEDASTNTSLMMMMMVKADTVDATTQAIAIPVCESETQTNASEKAEVPAHICEAKGECNDCVAWASVFAELKGRYLELLEVVEGGGRKRG